MWPLSLFLTFAFVGGGLSGPDRFEKQASAERDLLHPGPHLIMDQLLIRRAKHVSGHFAKRCRNKQWCRPESFGGVAIEQAREEMRFFTFWDLLC